MALRRGFHHRLFGKRQGLPGILESLVPNGSTPFIPQVATTPTASQSTVNPLGPNGVIGGMTSLAGEVSSLILPSSGPPTTKSSAPVTLSSSSTGSASTSASSANAAPSASPAPTSTTNPLTTSTPPPTSTPPVPDTVYTTTEGTKVVYVTSTLPSASATSTPPTSFLRNPSMEGGIFTLVGIVILIILFIVITWALRKRRRNRLESDFAAAVSFDPGAMDNYERQEDSMEKHRLSGSSLNHSHSHNYGVQLPYAPQQEYHGPVGYPALVYNTPPTPAPYQPPPPAVPQPAAQGGANLTRKFSDRKPVPPLLPNPAYDPSNTHVSIPPQFYQQ